MPEPVFSADDVAAVLERAAELQRQGKKQSSEPGLTLTELEEIAKESGIDPSHVREAAFEIAKPQIPTVQKSPGYQQIIVERTVKAPFNSEFVEDVVAELRNRYDSAHSSYSYGGTSYGGSRVEHIGRSVEWIHTDMGGYERRVRLQPRGDQLRIRMSAPGGWSTPPIESGTYAFLLSVLSGFFVGMGTSSWMWAFTVALPVFVVFFPLFNVLINKTRQNRHFRSRETVDWIAEYALSMAKSPQPTFTPSPEVVLPQEDEFGVQDEHTHFHSSRTRT